MSAIWVKCKRHYMLFNTLLELLLLLGHVYHFNETLHRVGAFLVARYFQNVRTEHIEDLEPLARAAAREKLLAEIITIRVRHKLVHPMETLFNRKVDKVGGSASQNLL